MRVEVALIERGLGVENHDNGSRLRKEWLAWKTLFDDKFKDRTWIGVLIMVFQRTLCPLSKRFSF